MSARTSVLGGMAIRRIITAQRCAASLTGPQMDPSGAYLYALFALTPLRMPDSCNLIYMNASFFSHRLLPIRSALDARRILGFHLLL
jgi:hypothetical protein